MSLWSSPRMAVGKKVSKRQASLKQLVNEAAKGNWRALKLMVDIVQDDERRRIATVVRYAVLTLWALAAFFPIYWMVSTSFKQDNQWFSWPPVYFPDPPTLASTLKTKDLLAAAGMTAALPAPRKGEVVTTITLGRYLEKSIDKIRVNR